MKARVVVKFRGNFDITVGEIECVNILDGYMKLEQSCGMVEYRNLKEKYIKKALEEYSDKLEAKRDMMGVILYPVKIT